MEYCITKNIDELQKMIDDARHDGCTDVNIGFEPFVYYLVDEYDRPELEDIDTEDLIAELESRKREEIKQTECSITDIAQHVIYNLSKDYKKLYDLVMAGHKIPCYITYDFNNGRGTRVLMTTDLTECKVLDKNEDFEQIVLSTRGCSFMNLYTKVEDDAVSYFFAECKKYDLQFILPNEKGGTK